MEIEIRPLQVSVIKFVDGCWVSEKADGFRFFCGPSLWELNAVPDWVPVGVELALVIIREFGPRLDNQKLAVLRACLIVLGENNV